MIMVPVSLEEQLVPGTLEYAIHQEDRGLALSPFYHPFFQNVSSTKSYGRPHIPLTFPDAITAAYPKITAGPA